MSEQDEAPVPRIDRPDRADHYAKICYTLAALSVLNGVLT